MKIYVWIIIALVAAALILSVVVLCFILILKLTRDRIRASRRSITVRPKIAKPIDAFDESSAPYARISSPSVIIMPEYPLQSSNSIRELERSRSSSRKSNGKPDRPRYTFSSRSKRRSEHFVDRDPPSDESKCDYLDPLDLDLGRLHAAYIANNNNNNPSKLTNRPPIDEFLTSTCA